MQGPQQKSPSARRHAYTSKMAQVLTRWLVSLCSARGERTVTTACSRFSRISEVTRCQLLSHKVNPFFSVKQ